MVLFLIPCTPENLSRKLCENWQNEATGHVSGDNPHFPAFFRAWRAFRNRFALSPHFIGSRLLYIYGTSFLPPSCTRVGPVLAGLLFAPAEVLAYAFGYSSDSAFYIAAFIQCVAYVWLFWLMAPRQAGAQRRWS